MSAINKCPHCGQVVRQKQMTVEEVVQERIQLALDWAEMHPDFDDSFIQSLAEQVSAGRELSPKQFTALTNIIEKFGMEE